MSTDGARENAIAHALIIAVTNSDICTAAPLSGSATGMGCGTLAITRVGAPPVPSIFIGSAVMHAPFSGRCCRLGSLEIPRLEETLIAFEPQPTPLAL